MKQIILIFSLIIFSKVSICQDDSSLVDSLMNYYIEKVDYSVIYIKPDVLQPGDMFDVYKSYFLENEDNEMHLVKSWTDNIIDYDHYLYQLYYQEIRVEGATFTEHVDEQGYVRYAKGKLTELVFDYPSMNPISETDAFDGLIDVLDFEDTYDWAWEDSTLEFDITQTTGDSTATFYPDGQR